MKIVRKAHHNFCSGFLSRYLSIIFGVYPLLDAVKIHENVHLIGGFRNSCLEP
jgi:hypothetical protein